MAKRLRIFDWNTPWFWLVIFYQRSYIKPIVELSLWKPNLWQRWWFNFCTWEDYESATGAYATQSQEAAHASEKTDK